MDQPTEYNYIHLFSVKRLKVLKGWICYMLQKVCVLLLQRNLKHKGSNIIVPCKIEKIAVLDKDENGCSKIGSSLHQGTETPHARFLH